MTAAAAAETRTSHRARRVRVPPVPAPRSLSRQVRDRQAQEVEFLGYLIGRDGIAMSQDKLEAVLSWRGI